MLVTAKKGVALMLDGFDGSVTQVFVGEGPTPETAPTQPLSACFSPDDRTVLGGCEDGSISCWDAATARMLCRLEGLHSGRVGCVACNPKYGVVASACSNTALWIW